MSGHELPSPLATAYFQPHSRGDRSLPGMTIKRLSTKAARSVGFPSAYFLGFCWGLIIACVPLADFISRPPREDLAEYSFDLIRDAPQALTVLVPALLLLSGVPVAVAALRFGIDFRKSGLYPAIALCNVLVIAASLVGLSAGTAAYVVLVAYCFTLATALSAIALEVDDFLTGLLSAVAIGIAAVMLLMIWDGNYSYGRLMGRSGPNYWGMNALTAFFAALALRSFPLKISIMALATLVAYLCQSRGTIMAIAAGAGVVWLLALYQTNGFQRVLLVVATIVAVAVTVIAFSDFIFTKLLLMQDRERGMGSGGTGRYLAWVQTFDAFTQHPWFGVGYRQHERYLTAASSSHNAYLAALADTGLFGFTTYLALMLGGAVMAVRKAILRPGRICIAAAGFTCAFLTIGLVERVGLATGNAMGLVMIYATAWAFRSDGVRTSPRVRIAHRIPPSGKGSM